jgi:hypothetical protein
MKANLVSSTKEGKRSFEPPVEDTGFSTDKRTLSLWPRHSLPECERRNMMKWRYFAQLLTGYLRVWLVTRVHLQQSVYNSNGSKGTSHAIAR